MTTINTSSACLAATTIGVTRNSILHCGNRTLSQFLLCLLILVSAVSLTAHEERDDSARDASDIRGVTLRRDGSAIPQSRVSLREFATGGQQYLVSDDHGNFLFSDVLPGRYELSASKLGFITSPPKLVTIPADDAAIELILDAQDQN